MLCSMSRNSWWFFGLIVGPLIAVVVVAWIVFVWVEPSSTAPESAKNIVKAARGAWTAMAVLIAALVVAVGNQINGHVFGSFIDTRNKYSLSQLQVILWTVLVLSAWLAVSLTRIAAGVEIETALLVEIPGTILATLGLSAGSFALATGIKSTKKQKSTTVTWRAEREAIRRQTANLIEALETKSAEQAVVAASITDEDDPSRIALLKAIDLNNTRVTRLSEQLSKLDELLAQDADAEGLLASNRSADDAKASDIFAGDEVATSGTTDVGKVQMFFLTIALLGVYGIVVADAITEANLFRNSAVSLPDFPESLVALLGVSHAGYLAVKVPDKTPATEVA